MHRCLGWTAVFCFDFSYKSITMHLLQFSNSKSEKNPFQIHLFGNFQLYLSANLAISTIVYYFWYTVSFAQVSSLSWINTVVLSWISLLCPDTGVSLKGCGVTLELFLRFIGANLSRPSLELDMGEGRNEVEVAFLWCKGEKRVLLLLCNHKSGLCSLNIFSKDNSAH